MDLSQLLVSLTMGQIVIVDDYYATPDFGRVDDEALTKMYQHIDQNPLHRDELAEMLTVQASLSVSELMGHVENHLQLLWDFYRTGGEHHQCLMPLFAGLEIQLDADRGPLTIITDFCKNILKVEAQTFGSLNEAEDALRKCVIAFVDFRFGSGVSEGKAIEQHGKFSEAYKNAVVVDNSRIPKIIYLVSSNLPKANSLEAFRRATGVRTAFFKPLRKSDLSAEILNAELDRWNHRYEASQQLDNYLEVIGAAVKNSADILCRQLNNLELHDLALLNVLKLSVEQESLQAYLTWLASEALSSELRSTTTLQSPLLPAEANLPFLDGKIKSGNVLFELFSQIAISPIPSSDSSPAFGDIFTILNPIDATGGHNELDANVKERGRELFLVITPACDLIRCSAETEVLCVPGEEFNIEPTLADLLKRPGSPFGKGRHVIKYKGVSSEGYAYIVWDLKKLKTFPVKDLRSKYNKFARLSEIFAQEVKESALANASRVGIPVSPAFPVAAKILVKINFGGFTTQQALDTSHFESAIVVKGRRSGIATDENFLVFTEQFSEWMRNEFLPACRSKLDNNIPAQFGAVEVFFGGWKDLTIHMKSNKSSECGGNIIFKIAPHDSEETGSNKLEIIASVSD